jgi:plastocyanin
MNATGGAGARRHYDRRMAAARNSRGLAIAVAAAGLLATACGSAVHVGRGRTLEVALSEYRVNPSAASISAGSLTFVVRNYGRLTHNLVIAQNGHPQAATPSLAPGSEATIVLYLRPGTYTMASSILSDAGLGERGTLTVN